MAMRTPVEKLQMNLGPLSSLWIGASLPWKALHLIFTRRRLFLWSLVPIGIAMALYGALLPQISTGAQQLVSQALTALGVEKLGGFGEGVLLFFSWITSLLILIFAALTFSSVAAVIASPFNDFLAEAAERDSTPPLPTVPPPSWSQRFRMIGMDAFKTIAAAMIYLLTLILSWIPVINLGAALLTFWLVTFQFISYPQTRRGHGLVYGIRFIANHVFLCTGFGGMMTLLFSIPVLSGFFLPVAVVGGTLLVGVAQKKSMQLILNSGKK